ncbi:hypothetical protein [Bartonella quintana]|uniref:hypothetical protein n=1 Tax=Bartonella quintana TaxID=803 RepID=UPI0004B4B156|nr:hypothetical protein [Bartonella quintana]
MRLTRISLQWGLSGYPQYGINKRNRISLFCCFENATVAFGRAVDKNLLDRQTDKIDTSHSTFS